MAFLLSRQPGTNSAAANARADTDPGATSGREKRHMLTPNSLVMLTNYIKIAIRNLRRNSVFAAINIFGLAVGLAACLLITAYVRNETHYDRFASRSRDIYRVNLSVVSGTTA